MSSPDLRVQMYTRPGCPFCVSLRRGLRKAGVGFDEIDIRQDPTAAAFVRQWAGGNETVPTIRLGEEVLVNPRAAQVVAMVRTAAPHLVSDSPRSSRWGIVRRIGRGH
ncbi:MAG: glutaredoxin family protein [Sporichthyaceae bacterium]